MKLNIEDLALQADPTCSGSLIGPTAVRTFARLIVERCALECEDIELPPGIDLTGAMPSSAWESGTMYAATAIRNLIDMK